eukprot:ANDGO_07152.mRNA.1 leucine-rich repeat containing protein
MSNVRVIVPILSSAVIMSVFFVIVAQTRHVSGRSSTGVLNTAVDPDAVPMHLFIMAKCSTSAAFERLFYPVYESLFSIVSLRVDYIATLNASAVPLGVTSDYGPNDVAADIWELCAFRLNDANPRNNFEFLLCMSAHQDDIPGKDTAKTCADEMLSYAAKDVEACAEQGVLAYGALGATLLRESITVSNRFNASWAPVIWINNQFWCIWGIKDCPYSTALDVQNAICSAYKGTSDLCAKTRQLS